MPHNGLLLVVRSVLLHNIENLYSEKMKQKFIVVIQNLDCHILQGCVVNVLWNRIKASSYPWATHTGVSAYFVWLVLFSNLCGCVHTVNDWHLDRSFDRPAVWRWHSLYHFWYYAYANIQREIYLLTCHVSVRNPCHHILRKWEPSFIHEQCSLKSFKKKSLNI